MQRKKFSENFVKMKFRKWRKKNSFSFSEHFPNNSIEQSSLFFVSSFGSKWSNPIIHVRSIFNSRNNKETIISCNKCGMRKTKHSISIILSFLVEWTCCWFSFENWIEKISSKLFHFDLWTMFFVIRCDQLYDQYPQSTSEFRKQTNRKVRSKMTVIEIFQGESLLDIMRFVC